MRIPMFWAEDSGMLLMRASTSEILRRAQLIESKHLRLT